MSISYPYLDLLAWIVIRLAFNIDSLQWVFENYKYILILEIQAAVSSLRYAFTFKGDC